MSVIGQREGVHNGVIAHYQSTQAADCQSDECTWQKFVPRKHQKRLEACKDCGEEGDGALQEIGIGQWQAEESDVGPEVEELGKVQSGDVVGLVAQDYAAVVDDEKPEEGEDGYVG